MQRRHRPTVITRAETTEHRLGWSRTGQIFHVNPCKYRDFLSLQTACKHGSATEDQLPACRHRAGAGRARHPSVRQRRMQDAAHQTLRQSRRSFLKVTNEISSFCSKLDADCC